ncbi:DUF5994 family protein [Nocardioides sp. GCM10027113]|uniref:DUF5994 family protein n=1 Tax=unclassified Nocardioides TaxID=2615069 RepID=UPI00361CA7C1
MSTSPTTRTPDDTVPVSERVPLRLGLRPPALEASGPDGAWWPQSRDLRTEAADLVDNFPVEAGHVSRLLFSRPDWDDALVDGRGARRILARRGFVKVGSFPSDDTRLMVAMLATGQRLRLTVIACDADPVEAAAVLEAAAAGALVEDPGALSSRWDDEDPHG